MKKCNFVPYQCYQNIYIIDYNKLYEDGIRIILFDLDNTIMGYHQDHPTSKEIEFFKSLKDIGFIPVIMSNNHLKRIEKIASKLEIDKMANSKKPLKCGYKKILKRYKDYDTTQFIAIGDQIVTDIWGANRNGIKAILINAIRLDNEKWYTRFNRRLENYIIEKKIKKHDINIYNNIKSMKKEIE